MKRLVICLIFWVACFLFFSYKMGFSAADSLNCVVGVVLITSFIFIPFIKFKDDNVGVEGTKIHKDK